MYVISPHCHCCLQLMCLPVTIPPIMAFYGVLHFVYVFTIRLFSLKAVFEVVWTCLSTITCPQQVSTALPRFTFWYLHMPIWCSCLVNFISFASPRSFPQALLILHLHVSYWTKVMTAFSFPVFKYLTVYPNSVKNLFIWSLFLPTHCQHFAIAPHA